MKFKIKKYLYTLFNVGILLCLAPTSKSQNPVIDSLQNILKVLSPEDLPKADDTTKMETLRQIGFQYIKTGDFNKAMSYVEQSRTIAEKLNLSKNKTIAKTAKKGLGKTINCMGSIYYRLGNYPKALIHYIMAMKIAEEMGDEAGVSSLLHNIAGIYANQGDFKKALEQYLKSLKISEIIGLKNPNDIDTKKDIANTLLNIGSIYDIQKDSSKALKYHFKALKISEKLEDKFGIAQALSNIAIVYGSCGNYTKSLELTLRSLKICDEIGNRQGKILCNANIGTIYEYLNKYKEAAKYIHEALSLAKEIKYQESIKSCNAALSIVYSKLGDYKKSLEHYKEYIIYRDSLINENNSKKMLRTEMNFEFDKKEQASRLEQNKKDTIIKEEKRRQKIVIIFISIGLILVLLFAIIILRSLRQNQNKNILINKQKALLEQRNIEITDSITYALGIQETMLPPITKVRKLLQESFVLFMPKAIVSGDFYWIYQDHEYPGSPIFIAAIDCTGHGVPGAFMSIIAHNLLKQIVEKNKVTNPAMILNELNQEIITLLQQNERKSIKDGMDIAICSIDYRKGILEYAGANNSVYIIRKDANKIYDDQSLKNVVPTLLDGRLLHNVKPDKCSIGRNALITIGSFTNNTIPIEKGDMLYLFTDGYADQKGGQKNKKFYSANFQQLLISISQLEMIDQKESLEKTINDWKGNKEQIDDILVMGIRI